VLEQAARASDETLILYSCGIESASVGLTADRLADLGYFRITRAGHYSLTPQGRALLSERPEQAKKVNPSPLRHGKVMILAAIIAAMATLAWFLV